MIFDMHIHERQGSFDSKLYLQEAIAMAEKRNLDGICLTDHDTLHWRQLVKQYQHQTDVLIIVGVEIFTRDGDLLCYGIDQLPHKRLSAQATIDYVHRHGGVCIAAHPFRENNRGLEEAIKTLDLDAIEVFNGRTKEQNNLKALRIAKNKKLPMTGGSDSHTPEEIGKFVTRFKTTITDEQDFIQAIKARAFHPVVKEDYYKKQFNVIQVV
jgi:predicted metal-dependent phosphoesterase TrpH